MDTVFVTGATGLVGSSVIRHLLAHTPTLRVIAGARNPEAAAQRLPAEVEVRKFDFEACESFSGTFDGGLHGLFAPSTTYFKGKKVFGPLLRAMKREGVSHIVFLSVQGAEKSPIIPHNRIERLIVEHGFTYVFLRPSYFMQNLTTTLSKDVEEGRIVLPSGEALFNWIDVEDIGEVAARILFDLSSFENVAIPLTGSQNHTFSEAAHLLSHTIWKKVTYTSVGPLRFLRHCMALEIPVAKALVMLMLHTLPRFQSPPECSDNVEKITGKAPTSLHSFLKREFQPSSQNQKSC